MVSSLRISILLSLLCIELMLLMFCELGARELPVYLTVVFTGVFGVLLVLNSLGCFLRQRWKRGRRQAGNHDGPPQKKSRAISLNNATVSSASRSLLILFLSIYPVSSPPPHSLSFYSRKSSFKDFIFLFCPHLLFALRPFLSVILSLSTCS